MDPPSTKGPKVQDRITWDPPPTKKARAPNFRIELPGDESSKKSVMDGLHSMEEVSVTQTSWTFYYFIFVQG